MTKKEYTDIKLNKIGGIDIVYVGLGIFAVFVVVVIVIMFGNKEPEDSEKIVYPTRIEPTYRLGTNGEVYDVPNPDGTTSRIILNHFGGIYREINSTNINDSIVRNDSVVHNYKSIPNNNNSSSFMKSYMGLDYNSPYNGKYRGGMNYQNGMKFNNTYNYGRRK